MYGWIPFEEFKKLPMQTIFNLLDAAELRNKTQRKNMPKISKGKGKKPRG